MSKRMLVDASHPEETRVVVFDGNKVEEFDFEAASKRPLKGNIYLAKVTRVEPSLQAAFVEYGGNRQGFLAFSEIHPDYYQIPVADRIALLEAQTQRLMADEDEGIDQVDIASVPAQEAMLGSENADEQGAAMNLFAEPLEGDTQRVADEIVDVFPVEVEPAIVTRKQSFGQPVEDVFQGLAGGRAAGLAVAADAMGFLARYPQLSNDAIELPSLERRTILAGCDGVLIRRGDFALHASPYMG